MTMSRIYSFLCALLIGGLLTVPAMAAKTREVVIPLNRSELLELDEPIAEIIVANPNIADVVSHGSSRISVIAKTIGNTDIRIFNRGNKIIANLNVAVRYDLPAIRKALNKFFPYERIGVEMVNDNVALTGVVSDADVVHKAEKIVEQFVEARTIETGEEEEEGGEGGGEGEGEGGGAAPKNLINMLQVRTGAQIMLRVRIGEIQRTSLKKLGANLSTFKTAGSFGFFGGTDGGMAVFETDSELSFGGFQRDADSFGYFSSRINTGAFGLSAALEALERDGLFKILAEPNLTATSGEKAEFLAGGEFPVPVSQGDDAVTVEFRPYGVAVQFTPYVLTANRVRLIVQPEVSELSEAGSVSVEGFNIPSLNTRRARTTVELAPGESFMIAGLLRDQVNTTVDEIPGVAEVPILSALFRSTSFQRQETELVIAVTPYLVDPVSGTDIRLPTDNYRPASVMEQFFYGALGSLSGDALAESNRPGLEGPIGFMVE